MSLFILDLLLIIMCICLTLCLSHSVYLSLCLWHGECLSLRQCVCPCVCVCVYGCLPPIVRSIAFLRFSLSHFDAASLTDHRFVYWVEGRKSSTPPLRPSLYVSVSLSVRLFVPPSMSLSFCQSVHLTVSLLSPSRYTSVGKSDTPASFDSRWSSDAGEEANNTGYKKDFGSGKVIYTYRSL